MDFLKRTLSILIFSIPLMVWGQPSNDNCESAIHLSDVSDWCSDAGQFTNINAQPSPGLTTPCLLQLENEVWFTFIPQTPAMFIQLSGNVNGLGTLNNPAIAVFEGSCGNLNEIGCNIVSASNNIAELTVDDLVIGAVYYILVEGQNGNQGNFQLCLDGFIPPPSPEADCDRAVVLCDKSPFFIEQLIGSGQNNNEVDPTSCIQSEFASVWYTWTCDISGTLTFTLTPNDYVNGFESDDLDFAVYELPNGIDDCDNKNLLRCMASGANTNEPFSSWQICNGPTGLDLTNSDIVEQPGCQPGNDNFLAAIDMVSGNSYALLVNNFSQSGLGFSIEWGGTGTFLGPQPDFEVTAQQAFECDKTIIFENLSSTLTDSIVAYSWNFGAGSNPTFSNQAGPIDVVYESFGDKTVALTIESSKGCVVTKILDFFVEPCCADTSNLDVIGEAFDQVCPGTASGVVSGMGVFGSPEYMYSLDGVNFQPSSTFPSLLPGDYTLYIQDEKGCTNQTDVEILPASVFDVDVGDTIFVDLGQPAQLMATPIPNVFPSTVVWSNSGSLTFNSSNVPDLLTPVAFAPGTTTYEVTIFNDAGCEATDQVVVFVNIVRPIFIPNVISANGDGTNDQATVYGGPAADVVEVFRVFDRWGGLVYEQLNFPLNDEQLGWDGRVNGEIVNPGVFTYYAQIHFLDNKTITYSGSITVVR